MCVPIHKHALEHPLTLDLKILENITNHIDGKAEL